MSNECLSSDESKMIKDPLGNSGIDVNEVENHGVIYVDQENGRQVIKSKECDVDVVKKNVRNNFNNIVKSNATSPFVQEEMKKALQQLDEM